MAVKKYLRFVAALAALAAGAAEERLAIEQLPAPVQRTLQASHYGANAKEATRRVVDGRTVYEIEIEKNNAPNLRVRIAEDGSYVREPAVPLISSGDVPLLLPPDTEMYVRLQLDDLPPRVQESVKAQAKGREMADIDREGTKAAPVYRVEIKDAGSSQELRVAHDGRLLYDSRTPANPPKK